ncbi:Na(+)-translocating NADH-quinone reductase subunit C [Halioxenophilus sp. WMMB6]|uniref:Na(+)-translocating NADH-quinone reductase subunit C n=1 Tax=Halioxenophilus sp. WMMB6 TaxID=3073815 RepID=UPI00295F3332|nr:Na(+)-translocating NADH-quinone reductase subunit C [Halioxenophilus sp. WMMB6]
MSNQESTARTIIVALVLCIVCSVIVSTAAVMLKPAQQANKQKDFQAGILEAAGLLVEGKSIEEQFSQITTKLVDLQSGTFTDGDVDTYDQWLAAKDPKSSEELSDDDDIAKISRLENVSKVFLVESDSGIDKIILPIRGYGLWSTLYGFIALEADLNTVVGIGFYEHGETPGLGGEVDNPRWKAIWVGKEVYGDDGGVALEVMKGLSGDNPHRVDALSGATLTSKGVNNLVHFWLGDHGFGPFLSNLKEGDA